MDDALEPLRVVIVGTADHGKSTLIGRLLNEAGALPADRVADLAEISRRRGVELEWAFVTDALQAERWCSTCSRPRPTRSPMRSIPA
jgi:bifunctional enzyme CysN/CysC